jgi:predicted O-linked N-acetylglucosamine transferase (SPINDLY family)
MGLLNRIFGNHAGEPPGPTATPPTENSPPEISPPENPPAAKPAPATGDAIRAGFEHHQAGDLAAAEGAYRDGLALSPDRSDGHYLLGSLLGQSGRLDEALEHLEEAVRLDPSMAAARLDMGNVFRVQGRPWDAEAAYRSAIGIDAAFSAAYRNLADLLGEQGRVDEAIECLNDCTTSSSDDADIHFMLADLLLSRDRHEEACRSYRAGLEIAPGIAAAHNNLGASLRRLSREGEALACFEEALRIDPDLADAHMNLADILQSRGSVDQAIDHFRAAADLDGKAVPCRRGLGQLLLAEGRAGDALQCYREILALEPEAPRSHFELGNALMGDGRVDEAIERFAQAVRLDGSDPDAHVNLGYALNESKRFEEARQCFRRALDLDPTLIEARNNLGGVLQMQGELRPAMQAYEHALDLAPDQFYVRSNYLTCLNYHDEAIPPDVFEQHRLWAEMISNTLGKPERAGITRSEPDRRLRIGYVSGDFRFHSVAFFMSALLEHHDRDGFEIFCYANVPKPDANTEHLMALADHWRDVAALHDDEMAAMVREDGIDILVDLSGHTVGNRLSVFARRPAPIQVTYLGYPNTTGLTVMDYRLTDDITDPPGSSEHLHSEELVRLPRGFLSYQPLPTCPEVRERPDVAGVTFASFNELLKITPTMIAAWCEILERSPGSRLLIKGTTLADEGTRARVAQRFIDKGIGEDRLELIGRTPTLESHLELYNRVDVGLDTFPYNGTTTTCEALWMGVPVVSLTGFVHAARVGKSILSAVGLDDLTTDDIEAYVEGAVALAADAERRRVLRRTLRDRMSSSTLMDSARFTRDLETAFRDMWKRALA